MWRRILALVVKELLALLKDRRSRVVLVGPPLIQLIIFSYAATFDLTRVPIAIYNEDPGAQSRRLVAHFEGSPTFSVTGYLRTDRQIAPTIDNKRALMVLHIGPHFSRDLLLHRPAEVQVLVDGRDSNTALIVLGYARSILTRFSMEWAAEAGLPAPPARLAVRAWFNQNLESRWFIVPGIVGLLTLVVVTVVTAQSVAREREAGTFDQLLVTPLRPVEILLGKALPGMLIGVVEGTFIIVMAVVWFRLPLRGSLLVLYLGLFLFLLSAIGVGLMISSFAVTQQQGMLGGFLFLVPAVLLSGFATPIANMPRVVQLLTLANPMRYFLVIIRRVFLEGASLGLLWPQLWPMAIIGTAALALAGFLFRNRLY